MSNGMKPYYQNNQITIYHDDCLSILPHLESSSFDLIFVDWPYFRVKGEAWDNQWDNASKFLEWIGQTLAESRRLLKPNGSFYGCGSPQMSAKVEAKIGEYFNVLNNIRWYKEDGWHKKAEKEALRSYLTPWESVIFAEQWWSSDLAEDGANYYSQCKALHKDVYAPIGRYIQLERERAGVTRNDVEVALGYVSGSDPARGTALCYRWEEGSALPTKEAYERMRGYLNSANCHNEDLRQEYEDLRQEYEDLRQEYEDLRQEYEDLRQEYEDLRRPFDLNPSVPFTDLWAFKPVKDYPGKHPTEKPLAMLEHIISVSTRPGGRILDFTMGAGTTLLAAKNLGREAVGVDITQPYCKRAVERLSQAGLFDYREIEQARTRPAALPAPIQMALEVE